jgi:hypothetical protein
MHRALDKAFAQLQPLLRQMKIDHNNGRCIDNPNVLIGGDCPLQASVFPSVVEPMAELIPPPDDFEGPSLEMSSPYLAESPVMSGLSSPNAKSTIILPTPTIELPSGIGALCASSPFPLGSSHQPFTDNSLSSVMSENSILIKRRMSNEDENDTIWKDDDGLNENHDDNKGKGKSRNLLFGRQQN